MGSKILKETPDDLYADTARQGSDCLEGFCYQDNVRWAVVASITGKRVKEDFESFVELMSMSRRAVVAGASGLSARNRQGSECRGCCKGCARNVSLAPRVSSCVT